MSKTYVEMEELEELLRQNGCQHLMNEVKFVSAEDIAEELSVCELNRTLRNKDEVIATQVWRKEDIAAAMASLNVTPDEQLINDVAAEAGPHLDDCSDGWDKLHKAIEKISGMN